MYVLGKIQEAMMVSVVFRAVLVMCWCICVRLCVFCGVFCSPVSHFILQRPKGKFWGRKIPPDTFLLFQSILCLFTVMACVQNLPLWCSLDLALLTTLPERLGTAGGKTVTENLCIPSLPFSTLAAGMNDCVSRLVTCVCGRLSSGEAGVWECW